MSSKSRLAVVIPALNEEASIEQVVIGVLENAATPVVVDDGSTDQTVEIAKLSGAQVIVHGMNKGYECALTAGIDAAIKQGFDFVATIDADGQLDTKDLTRFMAECHEKGSDIVVGIRDYRNRYSEYVLSWFGMLRFGINDPLCGLKLYRVKPAKEYCPFDSHRMIGMELAFRMSDAGLKISQLGIHVGRRQGVSRYGSSLRGEINILKSLNRVIKEFGFRRANEP